MASFQLISMSSYAKNKQQMCRVTQHQCNVAKCGKYSQIHPVHSLFVYYKKMLSWLNNLFMVRFQLIRMSSYAKNKLQMCWVTEHQCRSRQMCKIFTNSPSTLTFCLILKMSSFAWTIYSWKAFNSFGCSLMLTTNNRFVESINISVEVAKCGKFSHIHPVHSLFVCNTKWLHLPEQSICG